MPLKVIGGSFPVSIDVTYNSGGSAVIFDQVNTGLSTTDRIGWVLEMVEDFTTAQTGVFDSSGDFGIYGLCLSNGVTFNSITTMLNTPQVKWSGSKVLSYAGTPANAWVKDLPIVQDYTRMPDGGILMVPQPLYAFCFASGITGGSFNFRGRAWFHAVQLTDQDYFNLLQANQLLLA